MPCFLHLQTAKCPMEDQMLSSRHTGDFSQNPLSGGQTPYQEDCNAVCTPTKHRRDLEWWLGTGKNFWTPSNRAAALLPWEGAQTRTRCPPRQVLPRPPRWLGCPTLPGHGGSCVQLWGVPAWAQSHALPGQERCGRVPAPGQPVRQHRVLEGLESSVPRLPGQLVCVVIIA